MAGIITASDPSWIAPFTGLSPRQFGKLITALHREGTGLVHKGRPWSLPLEDRVLLVAAHWRPNLTFRQLAPLFGVSKSAVGRILHNVAPLLAFQQRKRFRGGTVLIVDGTLVPTRDHTVAEQSKNYRYSTNQQVVIDADRVVGDLFDDLGELCAVCLLERSDGLERAVAVLGVVDLLQGLLRAGLRGLRQGVRDIGALVNPAPLMPGGGEHLAARLPKAQGAVPTANSASEGPALWHRSWGAVAEGDGVVRLKRWVRTRLPDSSAHLVVSAHDR